MDIPHIDQEDVANNRFREPARAGYLISVKLGVSAVLSGLLWNTAHAHHLRFIAKSILASVRPSSGVVHDAQHRGQVICRLGKARSRATARYQSAKLDSSNQITAPQIDGHGSVGPVLVTAMDCAKVALCLDSSFARIIYCQYCLLWRCYAGSRFDDGRPWFAPGNISLRWTTLAGRKPASYHQ